jgi:L-ascorbate metabolism protein UlaG (beta-lactamase superfamily)
MSEMNVTYLGHAAILLEAKGKRVLMDPWLNDPIYHGAWWHYPPLALGVRDIPKPDYIYVSHEHADHFDPPTLKELDKDIPILIANFANKRFYERFAALGFRNIHELEFGRPFDCGEGLQLYLIRPDRPWDDSAILVTDGATTVLNVNDCHLDEATLKQLGDRHQIDLAFLTFTGASQYPGCFELPPDLKRQRWQASKKAHLEEFVNWAKLLRTKRAVPAAGNYALLSPEQLPLNTSDYVNNPQEAVDALATAAPEIEGLQMNPGDQWSERQGLRRLHPAPDWNRRIEAIEALSHEKRDAVASYFATEEAAPLGLYERFKEYFEDILAADPSVLEEIGIVTWWQVDGPAGGDWVIDFTRDRDWVSRGVPAEWNLRIQIPDKLIHLGVTDQSPWENLILSFRARLARQPDRYMEGFWTWFCKMQGRNRTLADANLQKAASNE